MAGSVNFKVRKGLEVTDSATIGGGLIASGPSIVRCATPMLGSMPMVVVGLICIRWF